MKSSKFLKRIYIGIVLIPLLLITLLLTANQYNQLRESHFAYYQEKAELVISSIETFVLNLRAEVNLLSNLIETDDLEELTRILHQLQEGHLIAEEFYFANMDAYMIATTSEELPYRPNISWRKWFQDIKSYGITDIYFVSESLLYEDGRALILIAAPVRVEGELTGIVLAHIPPMSIIEHHTYLGDKKSFAFIDNFAIVDNFSGEKIVDKLSDEDVFYQSVIPFNPTAADWSLIHNLTDISLADLITYTLTVFFSVVILLHGMYALISHLYKKRMIVIENQKSAMNRLELVVKMAGIFAHEIRNPLTGIMGFINLLKEDQPDSCKEMYFSVIEIELNRINCIVEEFLVLGKPTNLEKETHNLNDILGEIYPIIQTEAERVSVSVIREVDDSSLLLYCNADHMKQLFLNITLNAIQASSSGEFITIALKRDKKDIVMCISDNGHGIPDEVKQQLFTPF